MNNKQSPLSLADYLLSHLAQECCEVAVRATKAQHFGLDEVQTEQPFTNAERITHELCDLIATVEAMRDFGILAEISEFEQARRVKEKKLKAAKFREYSKDLGRLQQEQS